MARILKRRRDGVLQHYNTVPKKIQRQIILNYNKMLAKELKTKGRARLPELGILRIKKTKARKARWGVNPFTKERMLFKAKPVGKKVRFRASNLLKI